MRAWWAVVGRQCVVSNSSGFMIRFFSYQGLETWDCHHKPFSWQGRNRFGLFESAGTFEYKLPLLVVIVMREPSTHSALPLPFRTSWDRSATFQFLRE